MVCSSISPIVVSWTVSRCGEFAHAICVAAALYKMLITNYGHPERLLVLPNSFLASTFFGSLVTFGGKSSQLAGSQLIVARSSDFLRIPDLCSFEESVASVCVVDSLPLLGTVVVPFHPSKHHFVRIRPPACPTVSGEIWTTFRCHLGRQCGQRPVDCWHPGRFVVWPAQCRTPAVSSILPRENNH